MARIAGCSVEADDASLSMAEKRSGVLNRTRILANSKPIARGVAMLQDSIDESESVDALTRYIVILAAVRRSPYETDRHVPLALDAGLDEDMVEAFEEEDWTHPGFTDAQRAAFRYAMLLEAGYGVQTEEFEELRRHFSAQQIVEVSAIACFHGMLARLAIALAFDSEAA